MNRREALRWATALLGGIVSPSLVSAIAADANPAASSAQVFSAPQMQQITILTELIIPTTSTPGAIAAGVPQFVSMMVGEWYTDTERKIFFAGLLALDKYCKNQFKKSIHNCDSTELTQALSHFETLANEYISSKPPAQSISATDTDENLPFFNKLKELTVLGYFTSEIGVTQSLAYNPMPMEYKSDIPLVGGDKQWAQY